MRGGENEICKLRVSFFGAELGLSVIADEIASAVEPALALLALDDQLPLVV